MGNDYLCDMTQVEFNSADIKLYLYFLSSSNAFFALSLYLLLFLSCPLSLTVHVHAHDLYQYSVPSGTLCDLSSSSTPGY